MPIKTRWHHSQAEADAYNAKRSAISVMSPLEPKNRPAEQRPKPKPEPDASPSP